jgi:hypothetical protein
MDAETLNTKILDAETRGSNWLADGNEAAERGNRANAEKCYDKAQFWLDRANALRDKLYVLNAI